MAGQPEESIMVLTRSAKNAILEKKFRDASYFYWLLSQLTLKLRKSAEEIKLQFKIYNEQADIYYAYHEVYKYLVHNFSLFLCT
jgi:intraflagellar transport protein 122